MKTLSQTVNFKNTTALQVYELLMNERHLKAFTGEETGIVRQAGGKFRLYNDLITGVNVEMESPKKIVQRWRAADWEDKSHYSTVTFDISQNGNDAVLNLTQQDIPDKNYNGIKQLWNDRYWDRMKAYLEFLARG